MEYNTFPAGKGFRQNLAALLDDTKFYNNLSTVRQSNLRFYRTFNNLMIGLLTLLLLSTFVSDYALSLRGSYVAFILCSVLELTVLYGNLCEGEYWKRYICIFGIVKSYLFCLLSSVFYNRDAQAITFFVFLIIIPVCFTFRFRVVLAMQTAATLVFCVSTILVKTPEIIVSECLICIIFAVIGAIMSAQITGIRLEHYEMYRKTAILEKRNREIFDNTPCGMLELVFSGTNTKVKFANKTAVEMFGYTEEAFWQKQDWDYRDVVYAEDIKIVSAALEDPRPGMKNSCDFRLKNAEKDQWRWVSCTTLITQANETGITVLADLLDVDAKKRTESESEAKSRFLSRMSHEIRTPINAIIGMAELERQELSDGTPNRVTLLNYANETTDASKYLLTLVNDILDTSRIENNKIELHPEIVNARKYLQSVISLIKPLAESKKIRFSCVRETYLREAYKGDGVRLQQILVNILNNAIKFTPEGGEVTLFAKGEPRTETTTALTFTVKDTGIGMSEEFQKRLFVPFAQENEGTTSPFAGTGLGLNIARTLARMMGGDITCTSEHGKGTTFVTTVVVENAETAPEAAPEAGTQEVVTDTAWDFEGVRVLLCEDHPLNQKITRALLERNRCQVEIAGNGAQGVSMVASHPEGYYNLVLMDIRMPVMDGLQAAAEIRALPRPDTATLPIVAMSANAFAEDVRASLAAGMNDHLAKPVDAAQLYRTVARFSGNTQPQIPLPAVLVVDDIEMNAAIVAKRLERDYQVITASNGQQALEKLKNTPGIIAVITDIQMPVMNGEELIRAIRSNYEYDRVAILANTQYGTKAQTDQLLALGADDLVYKPDSPNVLVNRLRNVIARYKN